MSFFTLKVAKKIQETSDCCSLVFDIPMGLEKAFKFKAGQFISLEMKINGEKVIRSYSLSNAPGEKQLRITVKKVPSGLASNFLCDKITEGDSLEASTPLGEFVSVLDKADHNHVLFAAGSGIAPIYSIIKDLLTHTNNKVELFYSSRDEKSIILESEINQLAANNIDRFNVQHILTQPQGACDFITGRLSGEKAQEFLQKHQVDKTQVYMCGPDGFMDCVKLALKNLNFNETDIHLESFTPNENAGEGYIGDTSLRPEAPEKLIVELNGETIEVNADPEKTIIDTLLDEGHDPPYSCMGGHCMACIGTVHEGLTFQEDLGILTDENIQAKEVLTCQAKCASKVVKVKFDDFL